jgi:hypothetical protein
MTSIQDGMLIHPVPPFQKPRVENNPSARPESSAELRPGRDGVVLGAGEYAELFYMRIGRLSFRQRWIDRQVSPSLTAAVGLLLALGGFMLGFVVGRMESGHGSFSFLWSVGDRVLGYGLGRGENALRVPDAVSVPVSVLGSELYGTSSVWEYQGLV